MKISTRGRYGLKVVADIAHFSREGGCVSIKSVAGRLGLSENYLEQIVAPLKKARVVDSVRGAGGGYFLVRPAGELTVGEILRILEGPLAPSECVIVEDTACGRAGCVDCTTKPVWAALFDKINEVVDSFTIKDLMKDFERCETD